MEVSDRTSVNVRQDQVRLTALKEIMIVTTHHLYISSAINDHDCMDAYILPKKTG